MTIIRTTEQARIHGYFTKAGVPMAGPAVEWTSSDESVASVGDHNGEETLLVAQGPGTATLTGTASLPSGAVLTATYEVTVELAPPPVEDEPDTLTLVLVAVEPRS